MLSEEEMRHEEDFPGNMHDDQERESTEHRDRAFTPAAKRPDHRRAARWSVVPCAVCCASSFIGNFIMYDV